MAAMQPDIVDFSLRDAVMHVPARRSARRPFWNAFFTESIHKVFRHGGLIVDIGGGLRIDDSRGDRIDAKLHEEFSPYLKDLSVRFHVTDYTDKYRPDSVQDIHALTFQDASVDGLFCIAVLEHVYDPKKAAEEVLRVLKPGSPALLYVPFIYRYHATVTEDYRDYFRYSKDGIAYLFRNAAEVELCPVRGIFESLLRFTPLHKVPGLNLLARTADWSTKGMCAVSAKQTSGYFIRIVR